MCTIIELPSLTVVCKIGGGGGGGGGGGSNLYAYKRKLNQPPFFNKVYIEIATNLICTKTRLVFRNQRENAYPCV